MECKCNESQNDKNSQNKLEHSHMTMYTWGCGHSIFAMVNIKGEVFLFVL